MSERITHAPETQITRISAEKEVQHLTDISNNIQERIKREISFDLEEPIENLITISSKENEEDGTIRYTLEISPVLVSVLRKQGAINAFSMEITKSEAETNQNIVYKGQTFSSVEDTQSTINELEAQSKSPYTSATQKREISTALSIQEKLLEKNGKKEQKKEELQSIKNRLEEVIKSPIDSLDLDPKLDALATRYQQETVETLQTIVQNMVLKVWIKEKKYTSPESQTSEITDKNNSIKPAVLTICASITALAITVIMLPKESSEEKKEDANYPSIKRYPPDLEPFTQNLFIHPNRQPTLEQEAQYLDQAFEEFYRIKITNFSEATQAAKQFTQDFYNQFPNADNQIITEHIAKQLYARNIDFSDIANCQIAREMTILCGYNVTQYLKSIRPEGNQNIVIPSHHIDQKTKEYVINIIQTAIRELPMSIHERNILADQWLPIVWTEAFNDAKIWAPPTPGIRFSQNDEGGTSTHYTW